MTQLAIGIPTRNRCSMLLELLDDLLQYAPRLPVVISDNSLDDKTEVALRRYQNLLDIKYLHIKQNLSQAENFNLLLKQVDTKYIVMMHDDDRLFPSSLDNYTNLITHFEKFNENIIATYVLAAKFKDSESLEEEVLSKDRIFFSQEIKKTLQIFRRLEYISYFAEHGSGGKAPGVLLNLHLMKAHHLEFPADVGAKHDKAFFLTANSIGDVAFLPQQVIAKRLHENRSIHRNITSNYRLFNRKLSQIYGLDKDALTKVHTRRFEKWMKDEPRFRPVDCHHLLSESHLPFGQKIVFWLMYVLQRLPCALKASLKA